MQSNTNDADRKQPLTDVRVVDMTRLAAGNMLTHMLADFGAEVIKIERPGVGDDLRRFGDAEIWWKVYARSKKSMTLDISGDDGRDLLLRLLDKSDVLVENFLPGTLEKWGLGPDKLLERNPDLLVVRVSGWGQTGPYANRPGFGTLIEAMSGFASMTGFPDRPPLLPPLALADMVAGLAGFGGVMSALFAREKGKVRGQVIDLSLFEPLHAILGPWSAIYQVTGQLPQREGNMTEVSAPRNIYECADQGYLAMSASMQSMWEKVAKMIGRPELITDPKYATTGDRVKNRVELDKIVAEYFSRHTLAENLQQCEQAGVTAGPICDAAELLDNEYIKGRGVLVDVDDSDHGSLPMHQVFPRLSETPGAIDAQAPNLGQHTNEILDLLGLTAQEKQDATDRGIV
ncbi:MAG: CaiB/BaiF CoA-transferase family protein [Burkholderiaceae bacterium]